MAFVLSGFHENVGLASWLESNPPIKVYTIINDVIINKKYC